MNPILKVVLAMIANLIPVITRELSSVMLEFLCKMIRDFEKKAAVTDSPWDDQVAMFLIELFRIDDLEKALQESEGIKTEGLTR